jgi:mannose-6-phosphate isomerase-like protein (cupin superfamily)
VRLETASSTAAKGWLAGPWESSLPVSIGFANEAIDDPHVHARVTEIFLVAHGTATARVDQETIDIRAGQLLIVEPGERHTMLKASDDLRLFVVQSPGLAGDEATEERSRVPRSELGL